jgi:arylamine N-acetyltransferase
MRNLRRPQRAHQDHRPRAAYRPHPPHSGCRLTATAGPPRAAATRRARRARRARNGGRPLAARLSSARTYIGLASWAISSLLHWVQMHHETVLHLLEHGVQR